MLKGNEGINVGDVFLAIWGYEQTNASYYQVIKISGKTMVEIQEINYEMANEITDMSQAVKPAINSFKNDKVLRKKVQRYSDKPTIEISSFQYARQITKDEAGNYPSVVTSSYY